VNSVYSLIHIILMFFIWSGNHKFHIQFLHLLGLQSFIATLCIAKSWERWFLISCVKQRMQNDKKKTDGRKLSFWRQKRFRNVRSKNEEWCKSGGVESGFRWSFVAGRRHCRSDPEHAGLDIS
jgi:hypothetical protein